MDDASRITPNDLLDLLYMDGDRYHLDRISRKNPIVGKYHELAIAIIMYQKAKFDTHSTVAFHAFLYLQEKAREVPPVDFLLIKAIIQTEFPYYFLEVNLPRAFFGWLRLAIRRAITCLRLS